MDSATNEGMGKIAQTEEVLEKIGREYGEKAVFTSSFGAEDMVITHLISKLDLDIEIATIDTGRLHQATYDFIDRAVKFYGLKLKSYFPEASEVEEMVNKSGYNLFYDSQENRKFCCNIRKVNPLEKVLTGKKAWITGLRSEQNKFRQTLGIMEKDTSRGILKVNPLIYWTSSDVWDFIKQNGIPYNSLHDKGYPSIGCEPCTRAIMPGEDERAGRWWWEPGLKECGLHLSGQGSSNHGGKNKTAHGGS